MDNVEALLDEWFPGLRDVDILNGDELVQPMSLCPLCPSEWLLQLDIHHTITGLSEDGQTMCSKVLDLIFSSHEMLLSNFSFKQVVTVIFPA